MALIKTWPESTSALYDNKQWIWNEWATGTPITQNKLENLENGVGILATQIKAILGEFNPSSLDGAQLNASRLDKVQEWITGSSSTTYSGTNIVSRLSAIDTLNTQQNNKLTAIMSEIGGTGNDGTNTTYGGTSRIDSLATEVWGSNTTSGTSRIDKNDNKIAALVNELGGGTPDGTSTTYPTAATRLDDLEKEIGGTRSAGNGYTNSRIDTLESTTSAHTTKLSAIATEIWGTDTTSGDSRIDKLTTELYGSNITNYDSTSRLDTIETLNITQNNKLDTLITEIYGSNDTSVVSRLDDLEKEICGETITRTEDGGYNNSRIDGLELKVGNGAIGVDSNISAAIRRLSDTVAALDPTGSAEATSFLVSEVWGQSFSEDTDFTANSRIDNLETTTQNLGTQLTTLATEQNELEQNLAATNEKIPIEMYIATNPSASDTIVLDAAPRDKSIFFIAIPQGTLGINNLTLQTPDIQFNNILINRIYNGNGMKIKYSAGSLISIYRNGSNAYAYNVPMVL